MLNVIVLVTIFISKAIINMSTEDQIMLGQYSCLILIVLPQLNMSAYLQYTNLSLLYNVLQCLANTLSGKAITTLSKL